ncbi:Bromodomain-containing protein, partial [Catenaria anguillulae PL171]
FEKPVTEHEAPGYSLVISHPMSFETIKEKMRERAYKSKQAFVHDLQLIYDNCMAYN